MQIAEGSGVVSFLRRAWRLARWPLGIILVLYIGLVIYRIPSYNAEQRSKDVVAQIHAQKLTTNDVDGKHLPPPPDPAKVDATVEGIDANANGIRDDVELAIFKKYPNSAKIRAAELQYAMTEQMFLVYVFDTGTWKAVAEEDGRASACIALTYPRSNLEIFLQTVASRRKEVETLVFNTQARIDAENAAYKFITSVGDAPGKSCDIDLNTLSN